MHDIGKLPIAMKKYPEKNKDGKIEYYSLLTLPRKLSEEEFEIACNLLIKQGLI